MLLDQKFFEQRQKSIILRDNLSETSENYLTENQNNDSFLLNSSTEENLIYFNRNDSLPIGDEDITSKRNNIFAVVRYSKRKRGRKRTTIKKRKIHTSLYNDNILRKVQNHFLNFVISLINHFVLIYSKKGIYFRQFDYSIKSDVSRNNLNKIKNCSIEELLTNISISPKYKCKNNINIKYYEKFKDFPILNDLFKMKYLNLFNYYYNKKQPLNNFIIKGQSFALSEKTKSFYYLLEKNKSSEHKIVELTEKTFINTEEKF